MTHSTVSASDFGFFGLDVHKKTISIALATGKGEPRFLCTIPNASDEIAVFFNTHLTRFEQLFAVYEAGGCGYSIARQLNRMGITCIVAAPSKISKAPALKVKNDKKDALMLAKLLRNHVLLDQKELHSVYVPDPSDEAIREKTRQRSFLKKQVISIQNRIMGMIQYYGIPRYTLTKMAWTITYRKWLESINFGNPGVQAVFLQELNHLHYLEDLVAQCDAELAELCRTWNNKTLIVKAFQAFRGVGLLTAANLAAEIGNFSRFDNPSQLMGYIGLTPTEFSSGQRVTRGGITKAGNTRIRRLLIEAVASARHTPKSKRTFFLTHPKGLPMEVKEHAYKAQKRLHKRYWHLLGNGKNPNVAKVALARELLGFIWAVAVSLEQTTADTGPNTTPPDHPNARAA